MHVELRSATPDALTILLETKGARLSFSDDPATWPDEKRMEHLEYMRDTIKSSWEFVTYIFKITVVTRAFTHQLVRTRTGSYAQQAMRVVDARNQHIDIPPSIAENPEWLAEWQRVEKAIRDGYGNLVDAGAPMQDARGLLPTNITTNITAQFNLRSLHEMAKLRLCTRTQGEYQDVFRAMRAEVLKIHPWAEEFIEVQCVATGTCAFPRYGKAECPVYLPEMDRTETMLKAKDLFWKIRHEAAPKAKEGMAM
jgi:flavin-dependent thymidylate synthase